MKTKNLARHYSERADQLKEDVINEIRTLTPRKMYLHNERFEDEAGNTLNAVDSENVYFNDDEYPLEELGLVDAITILEILQEE